MLTTYNKKEISEDNNIYNLKNIGLFTEKEMMR